MTDFNINLPVSHATTPKYRLFQSQTAPGGTAPAYGSDRLNLGAPAGGAAGTDPALLAQTEQLMQSQNPRDRYQAIVNLTKMNPQDALPRLQAIAGAPGQDPNVVQLANEALRVMSQMAGQQPQQPQQPYPGQPQQPYPGAQPQQNYPGQQPQQPWPQQQPVAAPTYNPGVAATNMNPQDAQFMVQTLQTDLSKGGDIAINAIRQLAAIAQSQPAQKEPVYNMLLNHVYYNRDESVTEALRALGGMNNPAVLPYLQMVQRDPGYHYTSRDTAIALIKQLSAQPGGQPGTASVNGTQTPEFVRAMEYELKRGGNEGMNAFNQIRGALGPDPRAQGPLRQEVIRVMITHIATNYDPSTVSSAIQLLGQMGAREMDTLRYLDAVARNPGHDRNVQEQAKAAIRQIMSMPGTP